MSRTMHALHSQVFRFQSRHIRPTMVKAKWTVSQFHSLVESLFLQTHCAGTHTAADRPHRCPHSLCFAWLALFSELCGHQQMDSLTSSWHAFYLLLRLFVWRRGNLHFAAHFDLSRGLIRTTQNSRRNGIIDLRLSKLHKFSFLS